MLLQRTWSTWSSGDQPPEEEPPSSTSSSPNTFGCSPGDRSGRLSTWLPATLPKYEDNVPSLADCSQQPCQRAAATVPLGETCVRGRDGVVQWRVGGLHLHTDVIAEHSLLRRIEWRQRRLSHAGLRGGGDTGASVVARRPLRQHGGRRVTRMAGPAAARSAAALAGTL